MDDTGEILELTCEKFKSELYDKGTKYLEDKRYFTITMFVISVLVLWYTSTHNMWGDLDHYYNNAGDVLAGLMPYSEANFEYPPFCLVFMLIPRLLTWNLESFHYGCAILTYIFLMIGTYYLSKIADKYIGCRWQTHFILICLVGFSTYFVIARNDIYPTVLAIISFWLYMNKRYELAFIIMAIATMTKMYPGIFFIPMIIPFILKKDWKQTIKLFLIAVLTCIIIELPFLITDPSTAFAYLSYHSDRGIQIESVASGFFMVYNILVPGDLSVVFNYGSDNITGVGPDAIAPYMTYIMGATILLFTATIAYRINKNISAVDERNAIMCLLATTLLLIFITFNKVYSAQYMIWIIMLLPFSQLKFFESKWKKTIIFLIIPFGITSLLSYWAYPALGLANLNTIPIIFVFIKNTFHVLIMLTLCGMCWKESDSKSTHQKLNSQI